MGNKFPKILKLFKIKLSIFKILKILIAILIKVKSLQKGEDMLYKINFQQQTNNFLSIKTISKNWKNMKK